MPKVVPRSELRGMTRKDRREFVREMNRIARQRAARRRRARRIAGWSVVGVAAAGAAVGVAFAVQAEIALSNLGPANLASDGLLLQSGGDGSSIVPTTNDARPVDATPVASTVDRSQGLVDLDLYVDYSDPDAATLWSSEGASIVSGLQGGQITLELHPIAPGADAAGYATRAAAAVACVANSQPDQALSLHDALLTAAAKGKLPKVGTLRSLAADAGVTDSGALDCIQSGKFTGWVQAATRRAAAATPAGDGVTATTLFAAGKRYTGDAGDADAFTTFLNEAAVSVAAAGAAGADPSGADPSGTDPSGTAADGAADGAGSAG